MKSIDFHFQTNCVTQRMHSIDVRAKSFMIKFMVFFCCCFVSKLCASSMMDEWMKWRKFVWEKWRKVTKKTISSFILGFACSISFAVLMHHANVNEFYRPCNFLFIVFSRTLSIVAYVLLVRFFFSYTWQGEIHSKCVVNLKRFPITSPFHCNFTQSTH